MNFEDALKAGGASATIITIIGIVFKITQSFCGNRIRSECCGHTATAGVSVEPITPPHTNVNIPPSVKSSPVLTADASPVAPPTIEV